MLMAAARAHSGEAQGFAAAAMPTVSYEGADPGGKRASGWKGGWVGVYGRCVRGVLAVVDWAGGL